MALVVMDSEDLAALIRNIVADEIKQNAVSIPEKEKPYLTIEQFMSLMDISRPKATEVMRLPGFPATRLFGQARIVTSLLYQWVVENSEWVNKNAGEGWKKRNAR